jgi:hypothetical protein
MGNPSQSSTTTSGSGIYRSYVPAPRPSGEHRVSEPPRLRKTGSIVSLPPPPPPSVAPPTPRVPPSALRASLDEDMEDTRPMPKRTREDFLSIQRLGAALDELEEAATPWQVATKCASAMADALHAHAIVIHHHDSSRRELRSIGVFGPNAGDLLGMTTSVDDDYVATAVLTNKKPLMLQLDGALPRFVPDRHRVLGSSRSLAAFPVIRAGNCMAILELVGVAEEGRQRIADACELVAQKLSLAFQAPIEAPPSDDVRPRPAAAGGSTARALADGDREHRAPMTFPKRAPTLLCRSLR